MVTNQSVEALPGVAGVRWYEIRRVNGDYSVYQQGTFAPDDGVHDPVELLQVLRGLRTWVGFRQTGIPVERSHRAAGRSRSARRR